MSHDSQDEPGADHRPGAEPRPVAGPESAWPPPDPRSGLPAYGYQPQAPYGYPASPHAPYGYPQQPGYPPATGGWAQQALLPSFPHSEPRPYHQMLRTWTYAWWKPVLGMLVSLLAMLLVMPLVLMPVLAIGVWLQGGPFWESFEEAATLQTVDPAALLYLNLVLGSMILVTWFVIRFIHRMRPRWLTSVVPKMRWRFLFICLGIAVLALVASVLVGMVVPGDDAGGDFGPVNDFTRTTAAIAIVVILTTPFQAAGEEYLFRGYLLQAFGSLFRHPRISAWTAILVTSLLFAAAHGGQNFPLFFDRFMFGLIAGWLVIRTGGLEAGIALHILNNFLAYGIAVTFGDLTETLTVSEVSWWNVPVTLTQSAIYALVVALTARRMGLQTRTRPPVDEGRQEPVPALV
jgi:uncharacterized protein